MKFKIILIDNNRVGINRNQSSQDNIIQNRIWKEETFDEERFYAYKVIKKVKGDNYGVSSKIDEENYAQIKNDLNQGNVTVLEDVLENSQLELINIRFVIVDTRTNQVFYNGTKTDVKSIMYNLFDVNYNQINTIVSVDEFKKLKKLKIKTYSTGQLSIYDENLEIYEKEFDFLEDMGELKYTSYELIAIEKGARIKTDQFKKMIATRRTGLIEITAAGFDSKGNEVMISSEISKKVELLSDKHGFKASFDLDLNDLVSAIKEIDHE